MISKHWQIQPHLQSSVLNHFNTPKIISIMLKLYPATLFRIGCCNLDAVTLSTESSHYFLMNNCSWNHPKICIAHSLSEKNNTFSASWEDFIGLQSTAWSPVSHPAAEHCKGPDKLWQKLPLKFKGVCSKGSAQKLEVTHYCFLLSAVLVSTLVSWCESEQNNPFSPKFASVLSEIWDLQSMKITHPTKTCLSWVSNYTKRGKNLTIEDPEIQKVALQRLHRLNLHFFVHCYVT